MRTALICFALALPAAHAVDPATLDGKVLFGYQGWFNCAGDGAPENNWRSWARGAPAADTLTVDMYPDLREFGPPDLCAVPGFTIRGRQAYLYSAWNPKIVSAHFRWMKEYGLDGVLAQRFVSAIPRRRPSGDVLLKNIMAAAREHKRVFALEYDVTGSPSDAYLKAMQDDWKYLVDELKITAHPYYLRHNGKPVLSVWGQGLEDPRHPPRDPETAKRVVRWFKSEAPEKYRVTYMGGTPSRWRTLTADAQRDAGWREVYAMMDVIQPWTVGRYRDEESADKWRKEQVEPDVALAARNGQMYMPVVFPGFSWANLKKDDAPNKIPRLGGRFLWRQAFNARQAGAKMLKIAMFDEVNEATAMFKLAAKREDAPEQGFWLTLDADGEQLPSDWYLRLSREVTRMFHGEIEGSREMPLRNTPSR